MTESSVRGGAVLIPTGKELKSYAIMRSLHRRGIDTVVASPRERIPHFASRYCSEAVLLPASPNDLLAYKDSLLELARRPDIATAYPVRECDAYVFAKFRAEFEEHISLVTPSLDVLESGHDRHRLAETAAQVGVPHADTRLLSEVDSWDRDVIVKSRYNILTGDYVEDFPAGSLQEVKHVRSVPAGARPDVDELREEMHHDPIVQDFIPQERKHLYTALWDHGEPLATYQHRQIRQNSWVGGGGVYRKSVHSQAVDDAARTLLEQLDWHGYACIEYVKDAETGEWKFLEINPRVWQSMPEAVRAGADFPYYYYQRAMGRGEEIENQYEPGVACHIAYGELAHLASLWRDESPFIERPSTAGTLWNMITSTIRHPRFDYIRLDDPRLFLSGVRETLASGVTPSRNFQNEENHPEGMDRPANVDERV
ncbi:carboxylate--amine ligase [Halapricum desulfuricans]|uniref:Putative ATP-grasp enzyme n=1 Tax=Halapricum desulfuricans TaxID=2841257 RepID=A0A897N484_9EURY|nr:carboxylate--amine ligase [Halapricum desulfuricans]QSG07742.1 putative ATP-grasp enzyme [Halapricum desulfuricans]